jgi:shikimate kinase
LKNIILIGMPASGKSTVGVLLARTLGFSFIDTDVLLQTGQNLLLPEIINIRGINGFLKLEEELLLNMETESHVIATGGSAVYSEAAMSHLKATGICIYLETDPAVITRRIESITSRGVVMGKGKTMDELFCERKPLYEKFGDITVNCDSIAIEETVSLCIAALKKFMQ